MTLTPQKLAANQANAHLSTGPRTADGKARASRNALRTGLTGITVLLPTDDADRYASFCQRFAREFAPQGEEECELVQALIDTRWRLNRIPQLMFALEAQGRDEYYAQNQAAESDGVNHSNPEQNEMESMRALAYANTCYFKQINALFSNEARLNRQYSRLTVELEKRQANRRAQARLKETRPSQAVTPAAVTQSTVAPKPTVAPEAALNTLLREALPANLLLPTVVNPTASGTLGSNFRNSPAVDSNGRKR